MQLYDLTIRRTESYHAKPNQLIGTVQFQGDAGKQEVNLSPAAILHLLDVIQVECCATAKKIAKEIPTAFTNVAGELNLLDHPLAQLEDKGEI